MHYKPPNYYEIGDRAFSDEAAIAAGMVEAGS